MMLERKGIEHRVVDLLPGFHPLQLRAAGFRGPTVPALKLDGQRVQHSIEISHLLDRVVPDPPLFPRDDQGRRAVEEAEAWGERELQPVPRRLFRWAVWHSAELRLWMARDVAGLPAPRLMAPMNKPLARHFAGKVGADDAQVRSDIATLPTLLDQVDELIKAGTIGGPTLNAADYQIGTTVRVLLAFEDLKPLVEPHPAAKHAMRVLPDYPSVARALPKQFLTPDT
jgi:glutathione S-transferase